MIVQAPATLETLAASIADIGQRLNGIDQHLRGVDQHLSGIDQRLGGIDQRLNKLSSGQREIIKRLESVEGETQALHNDVVELYHMATM